MFLEWLNGLGFFEHQPENGILMNYPTSLRTTIAASSIEPLYKDPNFAAHIIHEAQLDILMENCGQGLNLPIQEYKIMDQILDVYARWVSGHAPEPFADNLDKYYQKVFLQISFVFEPKCLNPEQIANQTQLVKKALSIFNTASQIPADMMSVQVRETLLKVVLGCSDVILHNKKEDQDLASKTAPDLLRVLFNTFLRSHTFNDLLWQSFVSLAAQWRHRQTTILQWNATCYALTQYTNRLIYGPTEGSPNVFIQIEGETISSALDLEPRFTLYAWIRVLYLLGNLEEITNPLIYTEAMNGLSRLTKALLAVGANSPEKRKAPDGNTIFHTLGPLLFEAINNHNHQDNFDKGKAAAYLAVISVLDQKHDTRFDHRYLACAYRAFELGLRRNSYIRGHIINNSTSLFHHELEGFRILTPVFLEGIRAVLSTNAAQKIPSSKEVLRNNSIRLLGIIQSFPTYFSDISIPVIRSENASTFSSTRKTIVEILKEAIQTEENSNNRVLLYWTALSFLYDNIEFEELKTFAHSLLTSIANNVVASSNWSEQDLLLVLDVAAEIGFFAREVLFYDKSSAAFIVGHLAHAIDAFMQKDKSPTLKEKVIVACYQVIADWLLLDNFPQWILLQENYPTFKAVCEVIELGLTGEKNAMPKSALKESEERTQTQEEKQSSRRTKQFLGIAFGSAEKEKAQEVVARGYHQPTDPIKYAANYLYQQIISLIDKYPTTLGPASNSTVLKEQEVLKAHHLPSHTPWLFSYDKTIYSIVPRNTGDDSGLHLTLFLRDQFGTYSWNASFQMNAGKYNILPIDDKIDSTPRPEWDAVKDESLLKSLSKAPWLSDQERSIQTQILTQLSTMRQKHQQFLKQNQYGRSEAVSTKRPERAHFIDSRPQQISRIFRGHMLFTDLPNFEAISNFQKQREQLELLNALEPLDKHPERECVLVSFMYQSAQAKGDPYSIQEVSPEAAEFLQRFGWLVNLNSHDGYTGGFQPSAHGDTTIYYANYSTEVIIAANCLMPSQNLEQKKQLINSADVLISWVDNIDSYVPVDSKWTINIIIQPQKSQLFRVKLVNKTQKTEGLSNVQGPLQDDQLLSAHVLGALVRSTAIRAQKYISRDRTKPLKLRTHIIEGLIHKQKTEANFHSFLLE